MIDASVLVNLALENALKKAGSDNERAAQLQGLALPPPRLPAEDNPHRFQASYKDVLYDLEQVGTGAEDRRDKYWHGWIKLACYTPILNNQDFKDMLELLVKSGMGGRIIGDGSRISRLDSFDLAFRFDADQRGIYGDGLCAICKLGYATERDDPKGQVVSDNGILAVLPYTF